MQSGQVLGAAMGKGAGGWARPRLESRAEGAQPCAPASSAVLLTTFGAGGQKKPPETTDCEASGSPPSWGVGARLAGYVIPVHAQLAGCVGGRLPPNRLPGVLREVAEAVQKESNRCGAWRGREGP